MPLAGAAEDTGAAFWPVDEPDPEQMANAFGVLAGLSHIDANRWMISEILLAFGRAPPSEGYARLSARIGRTWWSAKRPSSEQRWQLRCTICRTSGSQSV